MRLLDDLRSVTRYDLVLTAIPSAFVFSLLVAGLLSIPARNALVVGSIVGALALLDALFLNPPTRPENRY